MKSCLRETVCIKYKCEFWHFSKANLSEILCDQDQWLMRYVMEVFIVNLCFLHQLIIKFTFIYCYLLLVYLGLNTFFDDKICLNI